MEETDWDNYENGTIFEITLNRGNGEISLSYIFQGMDEVRKPNLRHYDFLTKKIGNRLDFDLTSITNVELSKKQPKIDC